MTAPTPPSMREIMEATALQDAKTAGFKLRGDEPDEMLIARELDGHLEVLILAVDENKESIAARYVGTEFPIPEDAVPVLTKRGSILDVIHEVLRKWPEP